jgi:hypothetical protein
MWCWLLMRAACGVSFRFKNKNFECLSASATHAFRCLPCLPSETRYRRQHCCRSSESTFRQGPTPCGCLPMPRPSRWASPWRTNSSESCTNAAHQRRSRSYSDGRRRVRLPAPCRPSRDGNLHHVGLAFPSRASLPFPSDWAAMAHRVPWMARSGERRGRLPGSASAGGDGVVYLVRSGRTRRSVYRRGRLTPSKRPLWAHCRGADSGRGGSGHWVRARAALPGLRSIRLRWRLRRVRGGCCDLRLRDFPRN